MVPFLRSYFGHTKDEREDYLATRLNLTFTCVVKFAIPVDWRYLAGEEICD
jgi:hypothetical protein